MDVNRQGSALPQLRVEPVNRPVLTQRWSDVVFLHWPYDPAVVQRLLPPGVTVDTHDGSAWIALVPFTMERLRVPGLPPLPFVGSFPEVNVRTYVHAGDRRGVWFFSLDVDTMLATMAARVGYQLPYCYGRAEHSRGGDTVRSRVRRRWPSKDGAMADIEIRITGEEAGDDPLVHFLTSRWGLISSSRRGRLRYAPVDHPPWPLYTGSLVDLNESLIRAAGLPDPVGEPQVLYSPGVDVRVGLPGRLRPAIAPGDGGRSEADAENR
ncbi:MAG: DUF2071 domain-containing protein [Acidobacteriota bacterium]